MNRNFKILVTLVCIVGSLFFIAFIFLKSRYPDNESTLNTIRSLFAIVILGAGIATVRRLWTEKDIHLIAKIIWSVVLTLFLPNFTLPIYLWLVEPKLKLKEA